MYQFHLVFADPNLSFLKVATYENCYFNTNNIIKIRVSSSTTLVY